MAREPREKKQGYGQNPNKGGRNIQKESPHNPRGNNQMHNQAHNVREGGRKKGKAAGFNDFDLPPLKAKPNHQVQQSQTAISNVSVQAKKVICAKSEQVQETLNHLAALQGVLNSYEQLQMDKNDSLKFLVDWVMQKELKRER